MLHGRCVSEKILSQQVQDGDAAAGDKAVDADGDTDMDGSAAPEEAGATTSTPEQPGALCALILLLHCCKSTMCTLSQHPDSS